MKIAFVHEYLNQFGGAERMLAAMADLFPSAPIYTLLYDEELTRGVFKGRTIKTSFLQNFPYAKSHHQWYPMLMPLAIEQFDFSEYDLVISVSASFSKGIITKSHTKHICYCLTPPRFLWDNSQKFVDEFGFPLGIKKLVLPLISYLRVWDHNAAKRVDEFWSISNFVGQRVKKYYRQNSKLCYPPVDTNKFKVERTLGDYFLMVGRLVSYKKFDVAIQAFNSLGLQLLVVGTGPQEQKLKNMAKENIKFLGAASDSELADLYAHARALIFPQEEDFGIVPLEAMASGRPVIAYRAGGALETIVEGKTGMFFDDQTPESLASAVLDFSDPAFKPDDCRGQSEKFNIEKFNKNFLSLL